MWSYRITMLVLHTGSGVLLYVAWRHWGWWAAGALAAEGILAHVQGQLREAAKR